MTENPSHTRALIRYRLERAHQTLNTAQILHEQRADTASIVNRAYYAMFYAALALLATIGEETSKHSGVMALFDRHFIKTGILPKDMGKFLHTAFDAR
ncbi:MAG: HEPN domain-containing protein [Chloroflexota bacterium]